METYLFTMKTQGNHYQTDFTDIWNKKLDDVK